MRIHPLVRIATQFATAIGGAALANALLGTTVVVTTSWFVLVMAWLIYALYILAAAALGAYAAGKACDALSERSFSGYGESFGSALGGMRGFFSRR